jgi:alkyl hydroperoxide reductase subunit AhpC
MAESKIQINQPAPDFELTSFFKGEFKKVKLSDYKGKYVVLFFYPFDFTFVCPTEICEFSDYAEEFRKNNCEVLGASTDSHFVHSQWCALPRNKGGLGDMNIHLLADIDKSLCSNYGCKIQDGDARGAAYRATYIIDGKGNLRHYSIGDLPVGRSVPEVLRLVQAFQYTDVHGEVCPAKWKPGAKTMVPQHGSAKLNEFWEQEHAKK